MVGRVVTVEGRKRRLGMMWVGDVRLSLTKIGLF